MKLPTLAECRKAAVALFGAAAEIGTTFTLHGRAGEIVHAIVAVGTLLGVYTVRNAEAGDDPAAVAAVEQALGITRP